MALQQHRRAFLNQALDSIVNAKYFVFQAIIKYFQFWI